MSAYDADTLTIEQPSGYDQVPTSLWLGGACSPGGVVAYVAIRRRANLSAGLRMPTRSELAEDMKISVRAADGRLDDLIAGGWLLVTPRLGHGAKGQLSNHYHLLWNPINSADDPRLLAHQKAVAEFEQAMAQRRARNAQARGASDLSKVKKWSSTRSTRWSPEAAALRAEAAAKIASRRDSYQAYLAQAAGGGPEAAPPGVKQTAPPEGVENCTPGVSETAPLYSLQRDTNPKDQTPPQPPTADAAGGGDTDAQTDPTRHEQPPENDRTTAPEPQTLPGLTPPSFADFWAVYPKRVARRTAERAWNSAVKRAAPETIVAAAGGYAADPNLPPAQYRPNPATWLNGDRWADGPCPPRSGLDPIVSRMVQINNGSQHLADEPAGARYGIDGLT